ncbi:ATPase of 26S proteasome regulatory subunit 4 [Tritrichomonas musculus]|uniref:ATPase of 26S proteasome regulatory subunit 4 n=1 Tax=Tritrichomonas musculus TaxID=1915356 RepID=A0ABR2K483_9EUKA
MSEEKPNDQLNEDEKKDEENNDEENAKDDDKNKAKQEKKKKNIQKENLAKLKKAQKNALPTITPSSKCQLRLLKLSRVLDWLTIEDEYIVNCEKIQSPEKVQEDNEKEIEEVRGPLMQVLMLSEIIDDEHAIVSRMQQDLYVPIASFIDKKALTLGSNVLCQDGRSNAIVGILDDDTDPLVNVMKVENAPLETYADVGGLEEQIVEIKEAIELPLTNPEMYDDIGIKPPKGVILYGPPGTGKTLLARAVANSTSASFLRVVGSELIQKYLGDGPKLVRELFKSAKELAPSIVFIDEIDAVGTKRYDSSSSGEREVQRTMLELLNQLDGFEDRGDIKVIMATNKIESLDPALIRPGRIDRKIEFPMPDIKTKLKIFQIHTSKMQLAKDVSLLEFAAAKDEISGADIKAICTEAGLLAIREGRMTVMQEDFVKAREKVMYRKKENIPEGLYI